ncbi:MAG: DEAD/DEAH box helicase family protein, partial [Halobacteriovoraceae bacterium]|nr:DEAD/DEAH box helicase family protein [Halobacteriovoraceae bacterium]
MKSYCEVAVNTPFNNSILTYEVGEGIKDLVRGDLVMVPLGKRQTHGCLLKTALTAQQLDSTLNLEKIKAIDAPYDCQLHLPEEELQLLNWVANYYHYGLGQHIFDCLPKVLKRPRPLKFTQGQGREIDFELNQAQSDIVSQIQSVPQDQFSRWLIHGVTGSGKTAIYLNLVKEQIAAGKSALFLLPEINL